MNDGKRSIRIGAVVAVLIIFSYLVPLLYHVNGMGVSAILQDADGLRSSWARSLVLALVSTILNLVFSLLIAIQLRNIKPVSSKGKAVVFLLLPVLLGSVSVAFIGRMLFTDVALIQTSTAGKLIMLLVIQFWQYGTLYSYLFWLVIQSLPESTSNYAAAIRLTPGEYAKDLLLPACRNLAILLFIVNFVFTIYEDAKAQIIFKASRGTDTELIAQWLSRNYLSNSLLNQPFAVQQTVNISLTVILSAILVLVVTGGAFNWSYQKAISGKSPVKYFFRNHAGNITWYLLLVFVVVPIGLVIVRTFRPLQFDLSSLFFPFLLTFLAALAATLISILLSAFFRLGWQHIFSRFDDRSGLFFILFFIVELIPPLLLLICGYQWLKLIDHTSQASIYLVWIAGHTLLTLPVVTSFLTVTHFRTLNRELDFFSAHRLRLHEVLGTGFLRRYKADYLLSFLIAFSLIWNESIINNILSDYVPSFVSDLKMTIEGRAVDFSKGISYLLVSVLIALFAAGTWLTILNKTITKNAVDQV